MSGTEEDFLLRRVKSDSSATDSGSQWITSYSDLITLLLVFFVIIVAASKISPAKLGEMTQSFKGGPPPPTRDQILAELADTLAKHGLAEFVQASRDEEGIRLVIRDNLLFASGEATIAETARVDLGPVIKALQELPTYHNFAIEGHTDDAPIHSGAFPSNWHLSAARALAVLELFKENGFKEERLAVKAFGEQRPFAPNRDDAGQPISENRQKNRRVVILVR